MRLDLSKFRKSLKLSQSELADSLHVSQAFYSQMERGERNIKQEYIDQLKLLYPNTDIDSFLTNEASNSQLNSVFGSNSDVCEDSVQSFVEQSPINIPVDLWNFIKRMQQSILEKDVQISRLISLLEQKDKNNLSKE